MGDFHLIYGFWWRLACRWWLWNASVGCVGDGDSDGQLLGCCIFGLCFRVWFLGLDFDPH